VPIACWRVLFSVFVVALVLWAGSVSPRPAAGEGPGRDPLAPATFDLGPAPQRASDDLLASPEASAATVFGEDERVLVEDTAAAPWNSIAYLLLYTEGDVPFARCSGAMLNKTVILTAAHCLYDAGARVVAAVVAPGADPTVRPVVFARASRFSVPAGWLEEQRDRYDYALVYLDEDAFQQSGPFLPVAIPPGSVLEQKGARVATAGFPADSARLAMMYAETTDFSFDERFIANRLDAVPGQSGSPVMLLDPKGRPRAIVGVLTREREDTNLAVRMTDEVITALQGFCKAEGCTIQANRELSAYALTLKAFCRGVTRCGATPPEQLLAGEAAGFAFTIDPPPLRRVTTRAFIDGAPYLETGWPSPPYADGEVFSGPASRAAPAGILEVWVYVGEEHIGTLRERIFESPTLPFVFEVWMPDLSRE
jgi:V8-like Glu-specific endopeptidase